MGGDFWSYTHKGSLIGGLYFTILLIFGFSFTITSPNLWFIPGLPWIGVLIFAGGFTESFFLLGIFLIIVGLAFAALGAFLGWIYSKFNNKLLAKIVISLIILTLGALIIFLQYQSFGNLSGFSYSDDSVTDCDKIRNMEKKELCYLRVAEAKKDISICEKINKNSYNYGACYYNALLAEAITSPDWNGVTESLCEQVPESPKRDDCYYWASRNANS